VALSLCAVLLWCAPARAQPPAIEPASGVLDLAVVRRVIHRGARDALRSCWRDARARRAVEGGRVSVLFVIDQGGAVTSVETLSNDLDAPLAECAAGAIRALAFPRSSARSTVTLPIDFTPPPPRARIPRVSMDPRRPYVVVP
jgi:TonB family protein